MTEKLRSDLRYLLRAAIVFVVAAVAAGAVSYTVLLEIREQRNILESGLVETTQLVVLALASLAYAVQAARSRETPRAFAVVALAVLAMTVREMDGYFDLWTGSHSFWVFAEIPVLAAAAFVAFRRFGEAADQLARFVSTPQCLLLVTGLVFAVVVAQLIGYKEIWNRLFDVEIWQEAKAAHLLDTGHLPVDQNIVRHVKNTVEESVELGSYLMILGSALLPPLLRRKPAA